MTADIVTDALIDGMASQEKPAARMLHTQKEKLIA
jgi:hypothetical protein